MKTAGNFLSDLGLIDSLSRGNHRQTCRIGDLREDLMKPTLKPLQIAAGIALLIMASGCATTETAQTDLLTAAGFKLLAADTPAKQELLKSLPAEHLSLVKWKGKTFYVQPDVANNRAYVGTTVEFHAYEKLRLERQLQNERLLAEEMDYSSMGRWNAWGPSFYGGFYGPYYR